MPDAALPRFRPCLTLQTLNRGDGLLGMVASGRFGPRSGQLTVARVDWTYANDRGLFGACPAPTSVLGARSLGPLMVEDAQGQLQPLQRDTVAESDALDAVRDTGLRPLPEEALQWRAPALARQQVREGEALWSLPQEDDFADFWADTVPQLQARGWRIVVRPGFAHQSVPVSAWRLVVRADDGEALGNEPVGDWQPAPAEVPALLAPRREGSWLLSLGVEIDGQTLDLAPLIADLLRRDKRWLDAHEIAAISDTDLIRLRAPGGRRLDAPAAPLKAIVGTLVDLLTDPRRKEGPLQITGWDVVRLDHLRERLATTQAERVGPQGAWQLQGEAGLWSLAQRLRQAGTPQVVAAPRGLAITLRPYQGHGLAWLQYLRAQHLAGILADDMGLGKTAQALAHVLLEKEAGRLDRPALVVVPTSLLFNWQAEAQRMTPGLRVLTLQGPARAERHTLMADHDLVLISYPLVWRDIEHLAPQPFHLLILDEAQTVKNAASRTAAAVRRLQARHRLCLTGTPLENHLGELWAQFDFLMPGYLGDQRSFQRRWRDPIEQHGETLRAQLLAQRVRPFILRRRKADVATELPPRIDTVQRLTLEGRQKTLYESVRVAADELVRRALKREGFAGSQITILDALLKLRQVCCDPYLLTGHALPRGTERAKMAWLCDTLPALVAEGRRILVFSQFTTLLHLLAQEMTRLGLPYLMLTGDTPVDTRGEVVGRFQSGEGAPVLLISLKAGGVGLNLTAADTVIHVDPWWNPAVEQQATDRAHRLGQTRQVMVYKLVVAGSIEERILALQARKAALAEGVLGHDTAEAVKFTPADLDALLAPLDEGPQAHGA
ncbi:MAG: helicase [Burkholderiales bacterium RIFCSPLOWO2_12_FULL_64_99]|nr:MAG: helicase [Burkholderiales bacterium RIFCSPHIGHO2_12_FULL_63_20]OGB65973.1 MAG: helicase [Burkholderiales bacterium RIFCSPLOWO2_12_FULL_64_99]